MAYDQQSANAVKGTTSIEKVGVVISEEDEAIKVQETVPRSVPLTTGFVDTLHRNNPSVDSSNADVFMNSGTITINNHSTIVVVFYFTNPSNDFVEVQPCFSKTNDATDTTIYYYGYPIKIYASNTLNTIGGKYIAESISFPVMGADKVKIRVTSITGNVDIYAEVV